MLVLSRKAGESLQIGRDVKIIITQIKGNRVKIGIEAPSNVRIRRTELPCFGEEATETMIASSSKSDVECAAA